jgi:hypothetical protein
MTKAEIISAMVALIPILAGAFVNISREVRRWHTKNRGGGKRGKAAPIAAGA